MVNFFPQYIVRANPLTSFNPVIKKPTIHPSVAVNAYSIIIGDVTINENVYIAPHVTIRADEGSPFYIGANSNIQDRVILHGLKDGRVMVNERLYSIYVGNNVSCAHGSIIHGPCKIEDEVFIGFNTVIFKASIGTGSFISHQSVVAGVEIAPNRFVPIGAIIDTQEAADALEEVPNSYKELAEEVLEVNKQLAGSTSESSYFKPSLLID